LHKETNQQRSGEENAAVHLVCLRQTILRYSKKTDASESREVYAPLRGAPPSRFLVFFFVAQLRKMAFKITVID
jgi:hypothetical protein